MFENIVIPTCNQSVLLRPVVKSTLFQSLIYCTGTNVGLCFDGFIIMRPSFGTLNKIHKATCCLLDDLSGCTEGDQVGENGLS